MGGISGKPADESEAFSFVTPVEVQVRKGPSFSVPAEDTLGAIRLMPSQEWIPGDVVVLLNKGFRHFRPGQNRSPFASPTICTPSSGAHPCYVIEHLLNKISRLQEVLGLHFETHRTVIA